MKIELIIETSYETSNEMSIYQILLEGVEEYGRRTRTLKDINQQIENKWNGTCSVRVTE